MHFIKSKLLKLCSILILGGSAIGLFSTLTTSCGNNEMIDIKLNRDIFSMLPNQQLKLEAIIFPEDATNKDVAWSSSNKNVATVDEDGNVEAKAHGTATITATISNGKSSTCEIHVSIPELRILNEDFMDSTLTLINYGGNDPNLQYSFDEGQTWQMYSKPITIPKSPSGTSLSSLFLKGDNPNGWSKSPSVYSTLKIEGMFSVVGNVMALINNCISSNNKIPCDYCFFKLFESCRGGQIGPDLPATELAEGCYESMFSHCSVPNFSVGYKLLAKILYKNCYKNMFENSLGYNLPLLPATELAEGCYSGMFSNCQITTIDLPATTKLAKDCYFSMFSGCKLLRKIKLYYEGNYDSTFFSNWVTGVASSGIFYYNGESSAQDFHFSKEWSKIPIK